MKLFGQQFAAGSLFDPISAVLGGVGLVTNIIGGIAGKKAATSAADIQTKAATEAGAKVEQTAKDVNPAILNAASTAGTNAVATAATGADAATAAAAKAAADAKDTAALGNANVNAATKTANDLLDPYSKAGVDASGTLQKGLVAGGDFNKTPTLQDLQIDPGYAFRLNAGSTALDRSAAARGGATSGGAGRAQTNFAQGAASQEYQNAFARFETSTTNRYNQLSGVANRGLTAGTTEGNNLYNAATFGATANNTADQYGGTLNTQATEYGGTLRQGADQFQGTTNYNAARDTSANTIDASKSAADYLTQGANAQAAGKVGGTNALWGGINGGVNAATGAFSLRSALRNPAAIGTGGLPIPAIPGNPYQ